MQFCKKKKKNRKIQGKLINVDLFLSKLCFFGVSSTELRTMVTVKKLSYPSCWVQSKDRGHGILSLGSSLEYFVFIPKFSGDFFNRIIEISW